MTTKTASKVEVGTMVTITARGHRFYGMTFVVDRFIDNDENVEGILYFAGNTPEHQVTIPVTSVTAPALKNRRANQTTVVPCDHCLNTRNEKTKGTHSMLNYGNKGSELYSVYYLCRLCLVNVFVPRMIEHENTFRVIPRHRGE